MPASGWRATPDSRFLRLGNFSDLTGTEVGYGLQGEALSVNKGILEMFLWADHRVGSSSRLFNRCEVRRLWQARRFGAAQDFCQSHCSKCLDAIASAKLLGLQLHLPPIARTEKWPFRFLSVERD